MRRILKKILTFFFTYNARHTVKKMGKNCRVNFYCKFSATTAMGDNCNFNGMEISGKGNVVFGDNFHSGTDCLLLTSNHNYEGELIPYDKTYVHKDIIIENNVWIGSRVIILGGVTLEEGCIIQAGSVVVSNIPKCAIAGGAPAKVFKTRDICHYEKLKKEGRFQ